MNVQNRRRFPRVSFSQLIGVLHAGRYQILRGDELGEGGLSFFCEGLQIGTQVVVTLMKVGPMCIHGIVRNKIIKSDSMVYGVEFIGLSFDQARRLRFYVLQGQT